MRGCVLLLGLLLAAVAPSAAGGAAAAPNRTVLVLHSYHQGYEWTRGQADGIAKVLEEEAPTATAIPYYLDWKRFPDRSGLEHLRALIAFRHPQGTVDALITTDDAALEFALDLRRELYGPVPLVHGGVIAATARRLTAGESNVAGVDEGKDIEGTVRMAVAANPKLRRLYLLRDQTESGLALDVEVEALAAAGRLPAGLMPQVLPDLPLARLEETLATLPPDSAVLLGTYASDADGMGLPPEQFLELMSERSSAPIYGLQDFLLGHGIVGGNLLSAQQHGRAVGRLAARLLSGNGVADLPAEANRSVSRAVDYRQAERYGIDVTRVGPIDRLINKPFSFLETYRWLVVTVGGVLLLLFGMVLVLSFALRERRMAESALRVSNDALSDSRRQLQAKVEELTASKEALRERERWMRLIAEASRDIIWTWDIVKDRRVLSGRVEELLGVDALSIDSLAAWFDRVHPDDRAHAEEELCAHLSGKRPEYRVEYRVRHRDGSYLWLYATGKALFDEQGHPTIMCGSYTDITAQKQQQARLDHLAHYDSLTGLPNRLMLERHVDRLIAGNRLRGQGGSLALLFLDMDNFKFINDGFGHKAGDELLAMMGRRISTGAGEGLFVARLGGDEFVVVVQGGDACAAAEVARRVEQALAAPFLVEGQHFYVSCSIGIARYPWDGRCFDDLLQNADTAMYRAKDNGRGSICSFTADMNLNVVERMQLLSRARLAFDRQSFSLQYQPQVATADGRVRGFEALVRWTDSELGPVSPDRFIPVCEDSGLIVPLGLWVLETACVEAVGLGCRGAGDVTMSVNMSAVQLAQHDFVPRVLEILARTGLPPHRLELEITESQMIGSLDAAIGKLNALRQAGIHIALDDFGTGYSSLTYLRTLPINTLKLDKAFINDVHRRPDARSMVSSISRIAHDLNRSVVAEGVEELAQWEALSLMGCDLVQGYFVSRPLPADRIDAFLAAWEERRAGLPVARDDVVVGMPSAAATRSSPPVS
ncbi:PAS domain S-box-containing protein/diguanylate cyclase (GGDEF) domain-containing protein [Azospirillum oryzae]|uniref:PAS domain S-box-containing protein/diguanylate cyclase (GGDEF) domain-containing protein n=2 Tax=Azospirillum oryzae TaxID=286727 RepID=A0A1X7G8K5_9PROT|nr:PAS domain S-box-containing protein/diguanylate cyclase (GGDEF) domain-containing protein [Azospirillum oryzae]